MLNLKEKFAHQSIRGKIIMAILFGCLVLLFSWGISRVVFRKTFMTINKLKQPNRKLNMVNTLFGEMNRLNPMQEAKALKNEEQLREFLPQSDRFMQTLDSLKGLCVNNTEQVARIDSMKGILDKREQLFNAYLKNRNDVIYNKSLSKKIRQLSDYITENINNTDSSVVTKQEKTTTTVINEGALPEKQEQTSFFKRLFRKKKPQAEEAVAKEPKTITTEDIRITIDTISVAQRDSFILNIEAAIRDIDKDGRAKVSKLLKQEFELYKVGDRFVNELQKLLHDIQNEEYVAMQSNTELLDGEFNKAALQIGIVLLVFLTLMAVLVYLIFSDIARSNRYKEQLVIAKESAEQSERVKQRFLANMSHEIRTPLQSIIGFAGQLKEKDIPEKRFLDIIHRSSEHLLQIVNEVLDYSRIVSGKFTIEKQDFDMRELLAEVADTMDFQAENKNIRFIFKAGSWTSDLYCGDAFRLKQILYNLIGNAIKFTDEGEVRLTVTATPKNETETEFRFGIKDTGIGMEPEQLQKIFNAFEQAGQDTQRLYGGTGLGLGIAKSLAEIQGGSITVDSEKGKGSCFTVSLTYPKAIEQTAATVAEVIPPAAIYSGKILVVDDDAFILQLCSAILKKHKLNHVCYNSPAEVLEAPWDEEINLVLLDIRMPGMSGTELCKRLKQKTGPWVKFVALTAQALPEERKAILKEGFSDILLKPFREQDVLKLVDIVLEKNNEPVSLKGIEALCMNDERLISQALDLFIKDTSNDLELFTHAVHTHDPAEVAETCHRLAAKTGQVGAGILSARLKVLEKRSRENGGQLFETTDFKLLFSNIESVIEKVKRYRQRAGLTPQFHT